MILSLIATAFFLLVQWVVYEYYYWPQKEMKRYKELFQKYGYKTYLRPFKFLGLGKIKEMKEAEKTYKDAFYLQKTLYSQYDVSISNVLNRVLIILVHPDLMKQFLSVETSPKYPKLQALTRGIRQVLGNGIAFAQGLIWKNKRKIISKAFNFELLKENIPKIIQICNKCFEQFDKDHLFGENTSKYNINSLSTRAFNRVMLKCFFGCDEVKTLIKGKKFQEFMIDMINDAAVLRRSIPILLFGRLPYEYGLTKHFRHVKEQVAIFRGIAKEIIEKRSSEIMNETRPQRFSDIIQSLVYERMDAKLNNQNVQYSDQDLIDEFTTFLVAGTDTTSRFFTMITYYVHQNPYIQERLRKEVNQVIHSDEDITYQNLKKLTYIDWIQNETTRFYGPGTGMFPRVASVDNMVSNVPIRKGTIITIQPLCNHFNPNYYKDPHIFRPQRWQNECDNIHPYAFGGFSGGMRSCLGKQLAHLESKIALIKLIKRYKTMVIPKPDITLCIKFVYEPTDFQTIFTK